MNTQRDSLWEIFKTVNDWIKVSDAKALALIGFQSLFLSFVLSNAFDKSFRESNTIFTLLLLFLAFALNAASIFYAFLCVNPRLKLTGGISPIYFGTIAEKFENSNKYRQFFEEQFKEEKNIEHELAGQVYINSTIAWQKFKSVAFSIRWLVASLFFWTLYLLAILLK